MMRLAYCNFGIRTNSLLWFILVTFLIFGPALDFASAQSAASPFGISLVPVGGGSMALHFQTQSGFDYRMEYKSSLTAAAWTAGSTVPGTGGGYWLTDTDSPSVSQRLYRVVASHPLHLLRQPSGLFPIQFHHWEQLC